jgi:uncharacterized membrane protein
MSKTEDFLTPTEEQEIVKAIALAEKQTSGEIRVHFEEKSDLEPMERAKEVFLQLNMQQTDARNGVLFYVAVSNKKFAVLGDEGINKVVATDFWESTKEAVLNQFKTGNFKTGLIDGITEAGNQLKAHFPYQTDDENELSNEISKG